MVPTQRRDGEIVRVGQPTETFHLDKDTNTVRGFIDGWAAAEQAAWLILHTERYIHQIYSYNYGAELQGLKGKRDSFLFPEIKRRIREALLVDARFTGTSNFTFRRRGTRVEVGFTLHTIYGDMEQEIEL